MIDITKAKADAEEGLRIAIGAQGPYVSAEDAFRRDARFADDSRTRAPEAYRNVIALADENAIHRDNERRWSEIRAELERKLDEAEASYMRSIANREQDLAEFRTLSARVAAAEAAEEKMTRKAEEHYERAVNAEAESETLREELRRMTDAYNRLLAP